MRTTLGCLLFVISLSAFAEDHRAEIHAAKQAFEDAYEKNDLATYFGFYAEDATVYFGGAGRGDMPAYRKLWAALMVAGGGVEVNKLSDLQIQVMPGSDAAVVTTFIDNRRRDPDGTRVSSRAYQTDVWQKIEGQWKIVSLHYTDAPDEETGQ